MTAGSNMIFLQVTFILYDLVANVAIDSLARTGYVQLVFLVFQLILLALSLLIFFLSVFYTYPVQTGQLWTLCRKFRSYFISLGIYSAISVVVIIISVNVRLDLTAEDVADWLSIWSKNAFMVFFVLQRWFAPFYYYSLLRASLRIRDPVFYSERLWNLTLSH